MEKTTNGHKNLAQVNSDSESHQNLSEDFNQQNSDQRKSTQQDLDYQSRTLSGDLFHNSSQASSHSSTNIKKKSILSGFEPVLGNLDFAEDTKRTHSVAAEDLKNMKQQIDNLQIQLTEFIKASQFKFDRIVKNMKSMEQIQSHHRQEIAIHYAELSGKMKEKRLQENKVSELVDRHNQIVNTFESRLSQMKKVIHDREIKFMQVAASLEEAQREIARLKRQ